MIAATKKMGGIYVGRCATLCNFSSNLCRNKWRGKVLEKLSSVSEAWPELMVYQSALRGFSSAIPVFSSNQRHLIVLIVLV